MCINYIQKYLGYRSNNLYFLFSHSWLVVLYNFGQVQRTSQVERKTKCSKKTKAGDIAVLFFDCLVIFILILSLSNWAYESVSSNRKLNLKTWWICFSFKKVDWRSTMIHVSTKNLPTQRSYVHAKRTFLVDHLRNLISLRPALTYKTQLMVYVHSL